MHIFKAAKPQNNSAFFFFSVFADAETLFYYARYARNTKKAFSLDEIQSLLNTAASQATPPKEEDDPLRPNKPNPFVVAPNQEIDNNEPELQMSSKEPGSGDDELRKIQMLSKEPGIVVESELLGNEEPKGDDVQLMNRADNMEMTAEDIEGEVGEVIAKEEWMNSQDVRAEILFCSVNFCFACVKLCTFTPEFWWAVCAKFTYAGLKVQSLGKQSEVDCNS